VVLGAPEAIAPADVDDQATADCGPLQCQHQSWWWRDASQFLEVFCDDVESLFISRRVSHPRPLLENVGTLAIAGGVSFALHETVDDDVAEFTAEHPNRWGKMQDVIGGLGNPLHHMAAAGGIYAYSLMREDVAANELGKAMFNASAIATLSTTFLKFIANTERPNGDPRGWPSGHSASTVAVAAVLDEYCGHKVGIAAYALAGLVAWERIDDREHDLSDVVFGAALGYVIGRTVASEHGARFAGFECAPYIDHNSGATGISFERPF
jgi:hypothetical protein